MTPEITPDPRTDGQRAENSTTPVPPHPPAQARDSVSRSHLFLVRMWEGDGTGVPDEPEQQPEWHGKAQNVVTGEARRFDGLDGIGDVLRALAGDTTKDERPKAYE